MKTQFFLEQTNFSTIVDVYIRQVNTDDGTVYQAQDLVFERVQANTTPANPSMRMTPGDAQRLMDELWKVGFRPTQGQQSEGQMAAISKHLADMRALVSPLAKVELPTCAT